MLASLATSHPSFFLISLSLFLSVLSYLLLSLAAQYLLLFDNSPRLLLHSSPLLRWDSFHFTHIATHGYFYEHEWAFFPALPAILRILHSPYSLPPLLAALTCDSALTLYQLSLYHLRSPSLALIAAILFLLPSSPVTLRLAPYTEPFFTYLSYKGMLYCTQKRWFFAAVCFSIASTFRSNGFLLSGYILWGMLVQPFITKNNASVSLSTLMAAVFLTTLVLLPFIYHNYIAYTLFCTHPPNSNPLWCSRLFPSIYAHVQESYWNSGFLRYWTLSQLPNFLISAPLFILILSFSIQYFLTHTLSTFPSFIDPIDQLFQNLSLLPHATYSIVVATILLTSAHVQIILRLASSIPLTYWASVMFMSKSAQVRHWILAWSVVWSIISIILWTAFLPPA
ncbi:glycosyltransferase family 76 protein [Amanita thiersii Skay4041]|uniref:GPI mannosyltransferase 2 n=1 Tax=Amanita thiersii Skay4041 TaxID=703135 RepID=A0A2A9NWA5_9AGAR|nr:glycosyltransferase family 76 protein [Amanita thiersii Skay4041]